MDKPTPPPLPAGSDYKPKKLKRVKPNYSNVLPAGAYELSEDIINPKPDRRHNQNREEEWLHWVKIPKGMRFLVEENDWARFTKDDEVPDTFTQISNMDGRFTATCSPWSPDSGLFKLIVAKLVPTKRDLKTFLKERGQTLDLCDTLLEKLIYMREVSYELLEAALVEIKKDWERETEEYEVKQAARKAATIVKE